MSPKAAPKKQIKPTQNEQIQIIDRMKARKTAAKLMKKYDRTLRELAKR